MNERANRERIFNAAVELDDPAQRAAFLDAACKQDAALRAEIESLLKHDDEAGSFIDRPAVSHPGTVDYQPVTEGPGTAIGPYKLLQKIGEGGFGIVYMAEQQQPVRRKVALKIIKPGMDTREVIARFESERQALALMDHPNIARVLDAGATASGRPYFVMELVKGVPITEFCDKNSLSTEKRLELFLAVCHAVQHAHQKGVIHRDIKPTNVMVTLHDGKPVPKVIDFGVAKATSQQLTEKTLFTAYGQMIGTPVYMSPEQAEMSGLDIDTRSDIYSLGVLLYELLTGATPFDGKRLRDAGYAEMQRIIREEEPPRPSTRVSTLGEAMSIVSSQRSTDPGRLRQSLRGDLDLIVMKAMEKERTRRYETPNSFAQDVERYLNQEAILARPASAAYKIRKFAQRNKAAVASGTAIAAALLLGTAVSTLLAFHAYNQRNRARANLTALNRQQDQTEAERKKAIAEAGRAKKAESLAAQQKKLADQRAQEAETAQAAEAEQRKAADDKRKAIEQQKDEIEGLNQKLQLVMEDQRRAIYAAEMNLVRLEAQRNNLPRLRELLMQQLPTAGEKDLRGWEWSYWYRFLHRAEELYRYEGFQYGQADSALRIAPEGSLAAVTRRDQTELLDIASGKVVGRVPVRLYPTIGANSIARNGSILDSPAISMRAYQRSAGAPVAAASFDVWRPSGEKQTFTFPEQSLLHLSATQISRDGVWAAALGNDISHKPGKPACRLLVWNIESGELVLNRVEQRELNRLAFSLEGNHLAAWVSHGSRESSDEVREIAVVFETATGNVEGVATHNDDLDTAFFLPGGKQLLLSTLGYSGSNRKDLLLWDVANETPRKLTSESMPDYVKGEVSPDGRLFAVTGHTVSTIRLIDTRRGDVVSTLHNEATTIDSLAFTADGRQLVACSTSGQVLRWDLGQRDDLFRLRSQPLSQLAYSGYALSPDQSRLAYVTRQGSVRIRTLEGNETVLSEGFEGGSRPAVLLRFSPDGQRLAVKTNANEEGRISRSYSAVELFDVLAAKQLWRSVHSAGFGGGDSQLVFAPDGASLFLESGIGPLLRLDASTGKPLDPAASPLRTPRAFLWADASGRLLTATVQRSNPRELPDRALAIHDAVTNERLGAVVAPVGTGRFEITGAPDGRRLALLRSQAEIVQVWDFVEERQILEAAGSRVAFSPNGSLLALAASAPLGPGSVGISGGDRIRRLSEVSILETATGRQVSNFSLAGNHADDLRFAPDGRRLLTLHGQRALGSGGAIPEGRLWDVESGRELMAIPVAEVNHYLWDFFYDSTGNRLTLLVLTKSVGTSGGWGSTVLDATPLTEEEDAQLIARRLVEKLLAKSPLPSDAVAALQQDSRIPSAVRAAAVPLAQRQPENVQSLAAFCSATIARLDAPADQRQAALRCAQALAKLRPGTLGARVLLGGAQYRAGLAAQALITLDDPAPVPETTKSLEACRDALLVLVEHSLGKPEAAQVRMEKMDASFGDVFGSEPSTIDLILLGSLRSEIMSTVGPISTTSPFMRFVMSDVTIARMFEFYDANHDGRLTAAEAEKAKLSNWSKLREADGDGNGELTLGEFQVAMRAVAPGDRSLVPDKARLTSCNLKIERDPQNAASLNERAWLLASSADDTVRNGSLALADAKKACELTAWTRSDYLDTLAAAHAATGEFSEAVKWQEKALAACEPYKRADYQSRLNLYLEGKAFRVTPSLTPRGDVADGGPMAVVRGEGDPAEYEQVLAIQVKACEANDGDRSAWNLRGYALYRLSRYEEALTALEKAEQIQKSAGGAPHPVNQVFLAMTHHRLNHGEAARRCLLQSEAAARSSPEGVMIWEQVIGEAQSLLGIDLAVVGAVPLDGWGHAVNERGDCLLNAADGKLAISIPASPHDLSATLKDWSAPRVLQVVEGDFTVQVKVGCELNPQSIPEGGTLAYHGAGLLLWADPLHFLRVERNAYRPQAETGHYSFVPSIEYLREMRASRAPTRSLGIGFHEKHTWLKVVRSGAKITTSFSDDGQSWSEPIESEVRLPKRLWIGVAAVNYSTDPLTVEFSELRIESVR